MRQLGQPQSLRFLSIILTAGMLAPTAVHGTTTVDNTTDTGTGTTSTTFIGSIPAAGVMVDAQGVLSMRSSMDTTGNLDRQRRREAIAKLDQRLARPSELRKVSLNRLEKAVAAEIKADRRPTDEMLYLAGLTELRYVFFYPGTNDIVLAGPAEGFLLDDVGHPVGVSTGRSVMQLEDLVVALRAFAPGATPTSTVSVSIDPTQEGLARMQQFLLQVGGRAVPADTEQLVTGLRQSLGLQQVTVLGISPKTHFANVLVEADYRMKLIGIGLEEPPVRIQSYAARASSGSVSQNAMQRWFFVPDYESVRISDDGHAAELVGEGVKLVGADELVRADGTRMKTNRVDQASKAFVDSFTAQYGKLALRVPVYAQLRNLIDMLIAAAYIQKQDFYGQAGWNMDVFGSEKMLPVELYMPATKVDSAVNAIWKGRVLSTPVGGGVQIHPLKAISAEHILSDDEGAVAAAHDGVELKNIADGQWWWD